jgi:spore germination protein GerM
MSRRRRTGRLFLLVAFICCAVALGLLMFDKYSQRSQPPTPPVAEQGESAPSRVVVLYFAAPDGAGLARESREIDSCADQLSCIRALITELIKGPMGELGPTLPQTVVNRITVTGGIATVDLGEGFVSGLPGGSSSEMTAVYSIVNSIAANIPGITGVKFLIDGRDTGTLKGNLDLRNPLTPDFSLDKSPTGGASGEPLPPRGAGK